MAALAIAVVANSCGGTGAPPTTLTTPSAPSVNAVVVNGRSQPLAIGEQVTLTATALLSDGTSRVVTDEATWDSSTPAVAVVSRGTVTAISEGAAAILARYSGKDGTLALTVQPRPPNPPTGLACGVERNSSGGEPLRQQ